VAHTDHETWPNGATTTSTGMLNTAAANPSHRSRGPSSSNAQPARNGANGMLAAPTMG
jgi:hypothetical protein